MENRTLNVGLTKSQVNNLIEFVELNFIQSVREDVDIDNIDYIIDMMDALKTLRAVSKTVTDAQAREGI